MKVITSLDIAFLYYYCREHFVLIVYHGPHFTAVAVSLRDIHVAFSYQTDLYRQTDTGPANLTKRRFALNKTIYAVSALVRFVV